MPPIIIPKQNPVNPAPPMAPNWAPVKPKSAPQLARMPPRTPKPMPAAKMAKKPAHNKRMALGAMPCADALLIVDQLLDFVFCRNQESVNAGSFTIAPPLRADSWAQRPTQVQLADWTAFGNGSR